MKLKHIFQFNNQTDMDFNQYKFFVNNTVLKYKRSTFRLEFEYEKLI